MKPSIFLIINILLSFYCFAQEICNNGIDDDYDGLIDLNDADCICDTISLIPNPSFEDFVCLPSIPTEMTCAEGWIQASYPTSDYWHANGATQINGLPSPPQPLPDGLGYVGFINSNNWQEYIGSCLTNQMQANIPYSIAFSFGFGEEASSSYISEFVDLTFYGIEDCANNLPFGLSNSFDCPANYGWDVLGSIYLEGNEEWVDTFYNFTPTANYDAFVIGGSCTLPNQEQYYYLDNLILNQVIFYEVDDITTIATACNAYNLVYNNQYNYNVQWYQNGIALVGETFDTLQITAVANSVYNAVLDNGDGCVVTNDIAINESILPEIIINEAPILNLEIGTTQQLTTTYNINDYTLNWQPATGLSCTDCENPTFTATDTIIYSVEIIDNNTLCSDETSILIEVFEIPVDTMQIDTMQIDTMFVDTMFVDTTFIDTMFVDTTFVDTTQIIEPPNPIENICVPFIPNVFTPNSDGINDNFEIMLDQCNLNNLNFSIYNRFGERVYFFTALNFEEKMISWNGLYNGKSLNNGVLVYVLSYLDANNKAEILKGNITLLR